MKKIVTSLFFAVLCSIITANAQVRPVTGTVKDEKGRAVASATVKVKGQNSASVADENGAFKINATALLASGKQDADFTASTDKLKAIATQKWIALTHYAGIESWTEYRRTNLPVIPQMNTVTDLTKRPLRFFYPGTEFGSNGANVTAQGTIDIFTTKLFWDID